MASPMQARLTLTASTQIWWRKRRLVYNAGLVLSGMSSLTFLAGVLEFSKCSAPDLADVPFKLVYLAVGYGVAMVLANLAFSLGPLAESTLKPEQVSGFRRWAFGLGFAVSFALPFVGPVVFLARCAYSG
jgi:hypothetical protein